MNTQGIKNIIPVLANGYRSGLPDKCAEVILALDMFFAVSNPSTRLAEFHRILRPDGTLILDDGHRSRKSTLEKLNRVADWVILESNRDYLRCSPK